MTDPCVEIAATRVGSREAAAFAWLIQLER